MVLIKFECREINDGVWVCIMMMDHRDTSAVTHGWSRLSHQQHEHDERVCDDAVDDDDDDDEG